MSKLQRFQSADELVDYFRRQAVARAVGSRGPLFQFLPGAGDVAAGGVMEDEAPNAAPEDYSSTNLQEAGVDESDVVKSDGTNFYIARGRTLRIVRANPAAELDEVGQLEFDEPIDSVYLYDGKVLVLATGGDAYADYAVGDMLWPPYYAQSHVRVAAVDVSDPANPAIVAESTLEGSLVASRVTNDRLVVVLAIAPELPENPTRTEINRMELDDILPEVQTSSGAAYLVPPENWYRPSSPDGYYTTAVITLDAADVESVLGSVAVMANAGTIYSSAEALYLTDANYDADDDYREVVTIHKLAYSEEGVAEYVASGKVPGRLLNQFSLGEHEGYLRVATHVNNFQLWRGFGAEPAVLVDSADPRRQDDETAEDPPAEPEGPYNAVYVLGQTGDALEIVGGLEGIAPNETIYSARFTGDHGYLVTYRQVDPLFVLDLRDPENPLLLGELKVPGFSDYLHPVDDTHLIGVGKYTVPDEPGGFFDWFQGVQISLFDVSDWANPTVVEQVTLGGRGSECDVSYTHKAFTYLPDQNLLVLPVRLTSTVTPPWSYGELEFSGVVAFDVDKAAGFTELGRVADVESDESWWYWSWQRAAVIGETVYSITPEGVRAAGLADFDVVGEVELTPTEDELTPPAGWGGGAGETSPGMPNQR